MREPLLALSRKRSMQKLVTKAPLSRAVVDRYVAGETIKDAVATTQQLVDDGLKVTLDYLGEDTLDEAQAEHTVRVYLDLLEALDRRGLASEAEVSVKLSAIGQALPGDFDEVAAVCERNARQIAAAAAQAGTTLTLDMEDHSTTDETLATLRALRGDFPEVGGVLQAYLYRTEDDAAGLVSEGSRIRICKGAYAEPDEVAYQDTLAVDRAYVRVLKLLLAGQGYPMIATHDPRIIEIATSLATRLNRAQGSYEFQMLYGVRPAEQLRLAQAGETMRVYVPFGEQWYGYLMRRMAERPANLALFARSLVSKK